MSQGYGPYRLMTVPPPGDHPPPLPSGIRLVKPQVSTRCRVLSCMDARVRPVRRSRRKTLLALAGAAFVAADAMADHGIAGSAGTYHHPRPAIVVLPAAALALFAWLKRSQFPSLGRVGLALCLLGAAANAASLVTNRSGVSDYLNVQISHYVITFNPADVAMAAGLLVIVGSLAAQKLTARPPGPSADATSTPSGVTHPGDLSC